MLFVFDLDGTLVDSRRDIADAANAVLVECGHPPHSEEAIGGMVGEGAAVLIARAFAAADALAPPDALDRFLRAYDTRLLAHTRPYDGIVPLLDALQARGTLAVLTNKPIGATRAILAGLGLDRFFGPRVLGGDGPHPRKPEPAGLLQLAQATGYTPEQTMMVGDSIIDFRAALNAGARACLVRWGLGIESLQDAPLRATDIVIDSPLDLLASL